MEKPLSEEIVDSILDGNKESFMAAFQAAIAAKVTDALEVKKVEIASTLITPEVAVEEEVDLDESKGKMDDEDEEEDEDSEDSENMKEEAEQIDEISTNLIKKSRMIARKKAADADEQGKDVEWKIHAAQAKRFQNALDKRDREAQLRRVSGAKARKFVAQNPDILAKEEVEQVDEAKFSKKETVMAHTIGKEFKKKGVGDASKGGPFAVATAMVRDRPSAAKKAYRTILAKK